MSPRTDFHVGRPNLGSAAELQDRFAEILESFWFTNNGPLLQRFEADFADYCNVKHCVAVSNGTVALELAIRALGLGGEVILPSFTFIATAHALTWHGLKPVFCDIDPQTLCIDPVRASALISPQTSAILGVHLYGRPCAIDALKELADENGIPLIFDAAHSVGCSHNGVRIGNFGACEVFSFHATKVLNTIEGGAITTNDDQLAESLRRLRNFGFPGDGSDETVELGINAKMNEFCAAMGLTNLASLQDFININRENFQAYRAGLSGIPGVVLQEYDDREECNWQYVVARVNKSEFGLDQRRLISELGRHGVLARRYFSPGCHAMEPYIKNDPGISERLPVTETVSRQVVALPTGSQLGPAEIREICAIIRELQVKR